MEEDAKLASSDCLWQGPMSGDKICQGGLIGSPHRATSATPSKPTLEDHHGHER